MNKRLSQEYERDAKGYVIIKEGKHKFINEKVKIHGTARAIVRESSVVYAFGSARVYANDSAVVYANDSAVVDAYNSSVVYAFGSAAIYAFDSSVVYFRDSAKIVEDNRPHSLREKKGGE